MRLETKPLAFFKPDANQPRKTFDEAELRLLGESLKRGQNEPTQAMPDGTLIEGERRYRAAKLVGLDSLQVIITDKPLPPNELSIWRLTTFLHRVDLTPHEKWCACAELMRMNPDWQQKDLADHLGVDPSSVTRLLSPSKCIQEAQDALRDGKIGISDAYALSKLPPEDQPGLLNMKLGGASRDALESQGRKTRNTAKNGDTDTEKTEKLPVALAAGVVIIKAKKGKEALNLAAAKTLLVEALAKVENAIRIGYSVRTAVNAWAETKDKVRKPRKPRTAKELA